MVKIQQHTQNHLYHQPCKDNTFFLLRSCNDDTLSCCWQCNFVKKWSHGLFQACLQKCVVCFEKVLVGMYFIWIYMKYCKACETTGVFFGAENEEILADSSWKYTVTTLKSPNYFSHVPWNSFLHTCILLHTVLYMTCTYSISTHAHTAQYLGQTWLQFSLVIFLWHRVLWDSKKPSGSY